VKKTAKLGDYLRYALFDKYFKTMGCQTPQCPAGEGYDGAHFLLSWYYAWGGSIGEGGGWSWRIGSSTAHSGYQNPFAAWVLAQDKAFKPLSKNGASDWGKSLDRQLEMYRWLQSAEGGIAGGATNSWRGRYEKFPSSVTTFYKLAYVERRCTWIRPATTGSASRPGASIAWPSSTTSRATSTPRSSWTAGSSGFWPTRA
jgi:hypothetical protein